MEENINELRSLFNSALVLLNSSDKDAINHDYFHYLIMITLKLTITPSIIRLSSRNITWRPSIF